MTKIGIILDEYLISIVFCLYMEDGLTLASTVVAFEYIGC